MNSTELLQLQQQYVLGTYSPAMLITRGAMSWVWDGDGRQYLDFATGISVCNLGHCHPRVTEAIQRQAATLVHVSNLFYNENQPRLAAAIARHSFDGRVFFANSGAEANEGMIKLARKWGHDQGKWQILCMEESFHGRTLATLAATGRAKYRKGFQPDVEGFVHVPF
ncbi:MAG: aminotransferase class III-fold pyridoxal phosphate-dependent enzyme, partial [Lentisphaeria bacterium]